MKKYRKGRVFYSNALAGLIQETTGGYEFKYDKVFLKNGIPVSISLPLREEAYTSERLFPFFIGLLPEGWYLDIVAATQKVDRDDAFGLLLSTTHVDTIGAVTVRRIEE